MAKATTSEKSTKETKKETVATKVKAETKKTAAKAEPKKITAKAEPKKITAKAEPKKIAAKPEPKKIATKKVESIALKEESVDSIAEPKKVKKAATTKKAVEKKTPAKKAAATKSKVKATPVETKAKVKVKKEAIIEETKETKTLAECIAVLQASGVTYGYDEYAQCLLDEANMKLIEEKLIGVFALDKKSDDTAVLATTLQQVADSMDIKAADFKTIKKEMEACIKTVFSDDAEKNAREYLKEFKICEKLLMIGQRKGIYEASDISDLLDSSVATFIKHFFELASEILPSWQYDDVKFYEDFAYAVLSQYHDLYEEHQLQILIDCADLYIKHADYHHGDEAYRYILRDNQIKDYIYYRFASVYGVIDVEKSKRIAHEALQYVDAKFQFHQNLVDIIQR